MDIKAIKYISMPKDHHRRVLLQKILRTLPYESRWIPGVVYDPGNPEFARYMAHGIASYLQDTPVRIKGVIGTWISHAKALEEVEDREGFTIVLEDDFVCRPGFFAEALRMVNGFDRDFDVILFDLLGTGPIEANRISPNIYRTTGESYPYYRGTHCVLVNNRHIPKILDIERRFPIKDVDGFFLGADTGLDTYIFYTGKCSQINYGSNTGIFRQSIPSLALGTLSWALWTRFAYVFGGRANQRAAVAG